jgi:hypothetical protein
MSDIPMVWWDATRSRWLAYLSCNQCGGDSYGIHVTIEIVKKWGLAGGGWEEVPVDSE